MLAKIVGQKFNRMTRACDMLCMGLGEDYSFSHTRLGQRNVAELALHVQSQWRFVEGSTILLAAQDIYEPYCENVPDDWDFDIFGRLDEQSSVFDVAIKTFNEKMQGVIVTEAHFSEVGDLRITFSNGVMFEQFVSHSRKCEQWRLIDFKNAIHMVCFDEAGNISAD